MFGTERRHQEKGVLWIYVVGAGDEGINRSKMDQAVSVPEDAARMSQNPGLRKSEVKCSKVKCRTDKTKAEGAQSVLPGARKAKIRCSKMQCL